MRGSDERQAILFSMGSIDDRIRRALLLRLLDTIRSERQLMEQLDYTLRDRWFVGLTPDDAVWVPTVFGTNRDRLLDGNAFSATC